MLFISPFLKLLLNVSIICIYPFFLWQIAEKRSQSSIYLLALNIQGSALHIENVQYIFTEFTWKDN